MQTETVLRQALAERIKPVLVINKVDRAVFEKQLAPEELFLSLRAVVNKVNSVVSIYAEEDSPMGSLEVHLLLALLIVTRGMHGGLERDFVITHCSICFGSCFLFLFFFSFLLLFFFSRSDFLRPSVHMLPGTRWCGAGLPPACWWLSYPAAMFEFSLHRQTQHT